MGLGRWVRKLVGLGDEAAKLADDAAIAQARTTRAAAQAEIKAATGALDLAKDALKVRGEVLTRQFKEAIPGRVDEMLWDNGYYKAVEEAQASLLKLQKEGGSDLAIYEAQKALQLSKDVLETRKAALTRQFEEGLRADVDEVLWKEGHFTDVSKAETKLGDATKKLAALGGAVAGLTVSDVAWAGVEAVDVLTTGPIESVILGEPKTEKLDKVFGELYKETEKSVQNPSAWLGM